MKMNVYRIIGFLVLQISFVQLTTAQNKEKKPEDTEVWQPVPTVITPGMGTAPPSDAIVLFDGSDMDQWEVHKNTQWYVHDGIVTIKPSQEKVDTPTVINSKEKFGSMQLHIEWMSPVKIEGDGQRRGNSGIFIQGRYELQVQDNYNNATYVNGQAGSIYKQLPPLANACRKPGEWQVYDVFYTAPKFDEIGLLLSPAYITVVHNGVLVQNHAEIKGRIKFIGLPHYEPHGDAPLGLQDHGNAVSFRNIWVRKL